MVIIGMCGQPEAVEAGVTLQQPEVRHVFSRGSCPWITGPWQWRAAQAPRGVYVGSDLCLHTGLLVAAAAVLTKYIRVQSTFMYFVGDISFHFSGINTQE